MHRHTERRGKVGRQEPIYPPGPASLSSEPLQSTEAWRAASGKVDAHREAHICCAPAFTHWALVTPTHLHLPLDSACSLILQPLLLPAFTITEPKPKKEPQDEEASAIWRAFPEAPLWGAAQGFSASSPWVPCPRTPLEHTTAGLTREGEML